MSKVIFERVKWQNFMATGNAPNEIILNANPITTIIGRNGNGKTTLINALCFGLFGKPFSQINKNQLVNTINGKHCAVEVDFVVRGKRYRVHRGIKPNIFEIWCDGQLINIEADVRDYQQVLEKQILRMNYKTFTQVVVLGSANFTPFMLLPVATRREVIEDLLDIRIFSLMSNLLKEKYSSIVSSLESIESLISQTKDKLVFRETMIRKMEADKQIQRDEILARIKIVESDIANAQQQINALSQEITAIEEGLPDISHTKEKLIEYQILSKKIKSNRTDTETKRNFFATTDQCPTCEQQIAETTKQHLTKLMDSRIVEFDSALEKLESKVQNVQQTIEQILDAQTTVQRLSRQITDQTIIAQSSTKLLHDLNAQLNAGTEMDVDVEKKEVQTLASTIMSLTQDKKRIQQQKAVHEAASLLLRDTGIKTAIIRQYLPILNQAINRYLNALDMFVSFELDETFSETIKSRHRDTFTYGSFSEGERARINLAILFAWRHMAKIKSSVDTNLLILDETFDSALDGDGIATLTSLIYDLTDSNVFIISHRQEMADKFPNTIEFEKVQNFSVIKQGVTNET